MAVIDQPQSGSDRGSNATNTALMFSMFAPPLLWLIHFQIIYAWVLPACTTGSRAVLFLTSAVCFGLVFLLGLTAWCELPSHSANREMGRRIQFMARVGIMSSALTALIIVAQAIAMFILSPCQP
jgi:hypothetical protein